MAIETIEDALSGENPLIGRGSFNARNKLLREASNFGAATMHALAFACKENPEDPQSILSEQEIPDKALEHAQNALKELSKMTKVMGAAAHVGRFNEQVGEIHAFRSDPKTLGQRSEKRVKAVELTALVQHILLRATQGASVKDILAEVGKEHKELVEIHVGKLS